MKLLVPILILAGTILFSIYFFPTEKKLTIHPYEVTHQDTLEFKTDIQPILVSHCSPCHFPGGKMFERLPFNKPETVLILNEKLLKRIKDSKENALIKDFISQTNSKE